jgi:hypothetical protein
VFPPRHEPAVCLDWEIGVLGAPVPACRCGYKGSTPSAKHPRRHVPDMAPVPVSVSKKNLSLLRVWRGRVSPSPRALLIFWVTQVRSFAFISGLGKRHNFDPHIQKDQGEGRGADGSRVMYKPMATPPSATPPTPLAPSASDSARYQVHTIWRATFRRRASDAQPAD